MLVLYQLHLTIHIEDLYQRQLFQIFQQQVANLNIEDRFILLNSGSAAGDGGLVVQTEADFSGVVLGYDDSESRWGFQQGTKLYATASVLAPDAYASAVVTSDDANYRKNGNIRVQSGEIYIYVE